MIPALLGEAILSAVNSSLDTWDQTAGGTLIERRLSTGRRPASASPPATACSPAAAPSPTCRRCCWPGRRCADGARASAERCAPVVVATASSHFSVQKSASLLGLGDDAVVARARPTRDRRMDAGALARGAGRRCGATGLVPMAVVATAGTTDFGCIDPLAEIADAVRRAYGAWLHVDAAYGCGLLVSPTRRAPARRHRARRLGHRRLPQVLLPAGRSSAVLVRDRRDAAARHLPRRLPQPARTPRSPNQVDKTLQTTRRFDALKLWMTLRVMGADGIGDDCSTRSSTWPRGCTTMLDARCPTSRSSAAPQLSTLVSATTRPDVTDARGRRASVAAMRRVLFASGRARRRRDRGRRPAVPQVHPAQPRDDARRHRAVLDLIADAGRAGPGDDPVTDAARGAAMTATSASTTSSASGSARSTSASPA